MAKLLSARFLLAGFILLLVVLLVLAVVGSMSHREVAVVKELVRSEDDQSMRQLNYTETRDGIRKWTVQAASAGHRQKQGTANLETLTLVIFNPSGDLTVTSDRGELDLQNRRVLLRGNVVLQAAGGESVYTDELLFVDADKQVRTDRPVRLIADGYTISGTGMRFDISSREVKLLQKVEAIYREGLNIR